MPEQTEQIAEPTTKPDRWHWRTTIFGVFLAVERANGELVITTIAQTGYAGASLADEIIKRLNATSLITPHGLERLTPAMVERALVNADADKLEAIRANTVLNL